MITLQNLPDDVWKEILDNMHILSAADVLLGIGLTCRRLHNVARSDHVWHKRFEYNFPSILAYIRHRRIFLDKPVGFPLITCQLLPQPDEDYAVAPVFSYAKCAKIFAQIAHLLSALSTHYLHRDTQGITFSVVENLSTVAQSDRWIAVCVLRDIVNQEDINSNLTQRYYATFVLSYFVRQMFFVRITKWGEQPPTRPDQFLRCYCQIMQMCLPERLISERFIMDTVEDIVADTLVRLTNEHRAHPYVDQSTLTDVKLTFEQRWTVVQVLCDVFRARGFGGGHQNDDDYSIERLCLHQTLSTRRGRPISWCALFHLCADRLHVPTVLLNTPCRVVLRVCCDDNEPRRTSDQSSLIDVWDECRSHSARSMQSSLVEMAGTHFDLSSIENADNSYIEICRRIIRNMSMSAATSPVAVGNQIELLAAVHPSNERFPYYVRYASNALNDTRCNWDVAENHLRSDHFVNSEGRYWRGLLEHHLSATGVEQAVDDVGVHRRSQEDADHVMYKIGQIMHHRRYNYRCVIYGWTRRCEASEHWMLQMGVHQLPDGANQPFYRVAANDGSMRYAAQAVSNPKRQTSH